MTKILERVLDWIAEGGRVVSAELLSCESLEDFAFCCFGFLRRGVPWFLCWRKLSRTGLFLRAIWHNVGLKIDNWFFHGIGHVFDSFRRVTDPDVAWVDSQVFLFVLNLIHTCKSFEHLINLVYSLRIGGVAKLFHSDSLDSSICVLNRSKTMMSGQAAWGELMVDGMKSLVVGLLFVVGSQFAGGSFCLWMFDFLYATLLIAETVFVVEGFLKGWIRYGLICISSILDLPHWIIEPILDGFHIIQMDPLLPLLHLIEYLNLLSRQHPIIPNPSSPVMFFTRVSQRIDKLHLPPNLALPVRRLSECHWR